MLQKRNEESIIVRVGDYMNRGQIVAALADTFNEPLQDGEKRKIVFWEDREKEFIEEIAQIQLEGVKVVTLTEHNQFYTKHLLEEQDPNTSYLIYTNLELETEDNWLLDTVLYSKTFYADRISFILCELQIDPSLRTVVKRYERFFNNKERLRKFQAYGIENYTEENIELAIMGVLCNEKTLDFEAVLKTVLMDTLDDHKNKYLSLMDRFFDSTVFWEYVANHYGYERERKTLKTLFIYLTVTAFSHFVNENYLTSVKEFIGLRNRTNALVFIDHWMHHKTDFSKFDTYAKMVEQEIALPTIIHALPLEAFKQAEIFPYIDRAIIIYIANSLVTNMEDYEDYLQLISLRRAKHYYEMYAPIYEALYYTVKMHQFYKNYYQGIPQGKAIDLYESYVKTYYKMDTYYRKFYVAYDKESNNELLKKMKPVVEHLYTNWYMGELNSHWSNQVAKEMTEKWSLPGVRNQQNFYQQIIAPKIKKGDRVFVIISDALRYEVGVELSERLNTETLGDCEVDTLLSVIPSITKLGMAALLPHKTLDFDDKARVLVDGKDASGLENRKKIIETEVADSKVLHFQDVLAMNKSARRETFKGKKLIYIYHDTIDAMGDKASTEIYTFNAVETAIDQLYHLVKIIRDDLSGTNVYVTADHGFVYQRDPLQESDLLETDLVHQLEMKRRYILSKERQEIAGQLAIDLTPIVKNDQQLTAYVPNATIRYRKQGTGVNFVHGGASLQEVVVPLLTYKNRRAGQKGAQVIEKVDIKLTNATRKITNSIFTLSFFQTEKVAEKMLPRTVVIFMADKTGNILSNEETIIGDRTFDNPADRTFKLRFVLRAIQYHRDETYYLMIKDTETGIVVEKIPFTLDLGIVSDFDF